MIGLRMLKMAASPTAAVVPMMRAGPILLLGHALQHSDERFANGHQILRTGMSPVPTVTLRSSI